MSLCFSRVHALSAEKATVFLVGGIPTSGDDLKGWKAFESFMKDLRKNESVTIKVETFEYGEAPVFDATPEEIAYFYMREKMRPDFIEARTIKIGESSFVL